jgi:hypothetical protein
MKKKKQIEVVPAAADLQARSAPVERVPAPRRASGRCVICDSEVAPFSTEQLCWVCRHLKISAWRDSESQAAIQE